MVRSSTLTTLLKFHQGPQGLGQALKQSLESDAVAPVLLDDQFVAMDRRVSLILQLGAHCNLPVVYCKRDWLNSGDKQEFSQHIARIFLVSS